MRKMVLIRGPQASGKTTLVRNLGLEGHRLSADMMRAAHRGHVLNMKGELILDQEDAHQIWEIVRQSLDRRLSRGEFVILDATFATPASYEGIINQAAEYRYKIALVDLYGIDEQTLRERNQKRPDHERVPEKSIEKTIRNYTPHDKNDERIAAHFDYNTRANDILEWIMPEVVDLNFYDRIVHIGDLQGVRQAAFGNGSPLTERLSDDIFYIFVGDALDRGIENGSLMTWILSEVSPRIGKNVIWIEGNHERHLRDFVEGNDIVSKEFENRTLPQLCEASPMSTSDIRDFLSKMSEYFIYEHNGDRVIVTHAGVPGVPDNATLIPGFQAMLGAGGFGADVDEAFDAWAKKQHISWYQVHGHRNRQMHPVQASERSFNLEGQAEFGGHVRMCVKTTNRWEVFALRNDLFRHPREWRDINKEENRKPHSRVMPLPKWIDRGDFSGKLSEETLTSFIDHEHVNIRTQESRPHIDTIAFGKSAFYGQHWDGITNKARGLFIDNRTRQIVARSWPKFFNLGEREDSTLEHIIENWEFPMTMSLKENGYLGIASWDHDRGEIIFSSKGSMDGEFASLFEEIAYRVLGEGGVERLTRAVRDLHGTATFEVISPSEDPHIVEYSEERLVLLDFIHNSEDFEKLDYQGLEKLAAYIKVDVRQIYARIPNEHALRANAEKLRDPESGLYKAHIEGVVIEDAAGRHVKIKSGWYDMWKRARSLVERLALQRRKGKEIELDIPEELEHFMSWVVKQDDSITDLPIIELRRRFLETPEEVLIVDREALEREKKQAEKDAQEKKQINGFMRGYDALLAQVRKGTASRESIYKLIERGNSEPHLKAAMEARDEHEDMMAYMEEEE